MLKKLSLKAYHTTILDGDLLSKSSFPTLKLKFLQSAYYYNSYGLTLAISLVKTIPILYHFTTKQRTKVQKKKQLMQIYILNYAKNRQLW